MQVGTYHDGRAVSYDEAADQFDVGGVPVGHSHVRDYDLAGQVTWVSDDMAAWARGIFPESPPASNAQASAKSENGWFTNLPTWGKVLFIIIWPVALAYGLFWMWKDQKYSQGVRIALTAAAAVFVFVVMVSGSTGSSSTTTASSESTEPAAEAPSEPAPEPAVAEPEPDEPEPVVAEPEPADTEPADATPQRPEGAESLGMTPEDFRVAWNAAASEFTAAELVISSIQIDDGEAQDVFQVELSENAFLTGTVNKDDGSLRDCSILAAPGDTLESLTVMTSWGVLIAATNPDLPSEERGNVLRELGLLADDSVDLTDHSARTSRGDVYYWVQSSDLIGIMFGAGHVNEM